MKISKQARRDARQLFRSCLVGQALDENRVRQAVGAVARQKPRGYMAILSHFQRLVRLEVARRTASIESAEPLAAANAGADPGRPGPAIRPRPELCLRAKSGPDRRRAHPGRAAMFITAACRGGWRRCRKVFSNSSSITFSMSTLLQEIEAQISGLKTGVTRQNVGTVREIGDGVAKIEGLSDAMLNEMLDFGNGIVGLALEPGGNGGRRHHPGRLHRHQGRPGSPHHRQAPAGARGQGPAGPRGQRPGPAVRRQGADRRRRPFIRWRKSPPASSAQTGQPAGADRHHGH